MPTYGYRCGQCGHEFEIFQRMSDDPLVECPQCGGRLSKMLYPVGVQFKGSGFYTTDYKNGSFGSSKSSSSSEGSSSGESKSDSDKSDSTKTATEAKSPSPATADKSTKGD
ncbi:MAG TPA: FmdB family zinc ribbon protein [Candidatus Dormibacteraeota bacterium]|jgi:putative FmdB family regulatory protein|nr:FmdB family zinc ribbon protein [Candidatus Dormibacteraeota bacterium]